MENLFLVFIALPLVVGGAVLVGAWLLTRIMPGDASAKTAGAPQPAAVPAHGPDYERLTPRRKASLRTGLLVLLALGVLTIVEFFAANLQSIALMYIIIILKAALIMVFFMHIAAVWRTEEAH